MTFWLFAAGLAALVLITLLRPLLQARGAEVSSADYDLEVYRDQLREIARAESAGEIGAEEAAASRTEIGRRLLAADERRSRAVRRKAASRRTPVQAAVLLLVVGLPLGSVGLYLSLGSPMLPAQPFAERAAASLAGDRADGEDVRRLTEQAQTLSQQLTEAPQDVNAWVELGRIRLALRNYEAAEEAFATAGRLVEGSAVPAARQAELIALRGEARTLAEGGQVTPQARDIFRAALAVDTGDPRSRFYLALERYQSGDIRAALDDWAALAADAPREARWLPLVLARIEEAEEALGVEVGSTIEAIARQRQTADESPDSGGALDVPPEQMAAIEGMVAGLAARLEEEGDDLQGWVRLAQSYEVLERPAEAVEAWAEAARLDPDNAEFVTRQARALRAASGEISTPETVALMEEALARDPENPEALWFLGLDAARRGVVAEAEDYFGRAIDSLPQGAEEVEALRQRADEILSGME